MARCASSMLRIWQFMQNGFARHSLQCFNYSRVPICSRRLRATGLECVDGLAQVASARAGVLTPRPCVCRMFSAGALQAASEAQAVHAVGAHAEMQRVQ